jgi:riboflavin synthase
MFTGIIEEAGKVSRSTTSEGGLNLIVEAGLVLEGIRIGDSLSIDGVCLTVESCDERSFTSFVSSETLSRTTLETINIGRIVNLERALAMGDRLGGHMVSGHVEAVGKIDFIRPDGKGYRLSVSVPDNFAPYLIEKGSVAVDGVSLTMASVSDSRFEVAIVPKTFEMTTFRLKTAGNFVNLEPDLIFKYVRSAIAELLEPGEDVGLTMERLIKSVFIAD